MAAHGVEGLAASESTGFVGHPNGPWSENQRAAKVEHTVAYAGARTGCCTGFFYMFPNVLCRCKGSIIPKVGLEVFLAILMGFLPLWILPDDNDDGKPDEDSSLIGHQVSHVCTVFSKAAAIRW